MHITFDIRPESSFYYRSLFSYFKDPVVFLGNNVIINKTNNLAEVLENHNQENTLFCNEKQLCKRVSLKVNNIKRYYSLYSLYSLL